MKELLCAVGLHLYGMWFNPHGFQKRKCRRCNYEQGETGYYIKRILIITITTIWVVNFITR